jgi:hypothetical protein
LQEYAFSWLVSSRLKKVNLNINLNCSCKNGTSGAEIAEKMLADNGIRDVHFNARAINGSLQPIQTKLKGGRFTISVMRQPLMAAHTVPRENTL